jgi:hypothetical protein
VSSDAITARLAATLTSLAYFEVSAGHLDEARD